jgi:phosphatidylglycerol:prolipoprotein diacylglycerol transferase
VKNRFRLPILEFADIIAPSMILGLSIGRLGCLMNGCCFGGVCTIEPLAVQFPEGSPPYLRQLETGGLLGIHGPPGKKQRLDELGFMVVESVDAGSVAEHHGIQPGDRIAILFDQLELERARYEGAKNPVVRIERIGALPINITYDELPHASLKIHPTQIYSSIDAALIFCFLWFYFPFRRHDGQVFALLLIIYPIARMFEEFIRNDEAGWFETQFTPAQWVSLFIFLFGLGLYVFVTLRKADCATSDLPALSA